MHIYIYIDVHKYGLFPPSSCTWIMKPLVTLHSAWWKRKARHQRLVFFCYHFFLLLCLFCSKVSCFVLRFFESRYYCSVCIQICFVFDFILLFLSLLLFVVLLSLHCYFDCAFYFFKRLVRQQLVLVGFCSAWRFPLSGIRQVFKVLLHGCLMSVKLGSQDLIIVVIASKNNSQ